MICPLDDDANSKRIRHETAGDPNDNPENKKSAGNHEYYRMFLKYFQCVFFRCSSRNFSSMRFTNYKPSLSVSTKSFPGETAVNNLFSFSIVGTDFPCS